MSNVNSYATNVLSFISWVQHHSSSGRNTQLLDECMMVLMIGISCIGYMHISTNHFGALERMQFERKPSFWWTPCIRQHSHTPCHKIFEPSTSEILLYQEVFEFVFSCTCLLLSDMFIYYLVCEMQVIFKFLTILFIIIFV